MSEELFHLDMLFSVRHSLPLAVCSSDMSKFLLQKTGSLATNVSICSQGVISVTLVMPQFIERFPEVSEAASGGASTRV